MRTEQKNIDELEGRERNPYECNGVPLNKKTIVKNGFKKTAYIESYGCQMNFSDSEIVASILRKEGYNLSDNQDEATLILLNTCSIRDKAEQTIRKRLKNLAPLKKKTSQLKVGILGCMAERLKHDLLNQEHLVDLIVGPDSYQDLPNLLSEVEEGQRAVNVLLSKEETYANISPVRLSSNGVTAFVSIMRGCDNMCTFCVVPFTRGRERSRDVVSILKEVENLDKAKFKEVTLLGQNVDSYLWYGGGAKKDFHKENPLQQSTAVYFSQLLDLIATTYPHIRIRFSTSNPQDMKLEVLEVIARHKNICNSIHLPVQSGSDRILAKMNRLHTREEYKCLIDHIYRIIPDCAISHDIMVGFPSETEEDYQDTLSLMEYVQYDYGYMFAYSERPNTMAARKMEDDIPKEVKQRRLEGVIALQNKHSLLKKQKAIGTVRCVLIEETSKRDDAYWYGRDLYNMSVVFEKQHYQKGDTVDVLVENCTSATLIGRPIGYTVFR